MLLQIFAKNNLMIKRVRNTNLSAQIFNKALNRIWGRLPKFQIMNIHNMSK
jgi:hypothetical protein